MDLSAKRHQLRNATIYQIFPRNYSVAGNLNAITKDLSRLSDLGIDFIYLLPIHPIGEKDRKGKMGSPYSIKDYRAIAPDLGTIQDFDTLVREAHNLDIKILMDVVFNHTSRDSVLLSEHPDWFYLKDGKPANRVGDWSDIADLDFSKPELRQYLIDTLIFWVKRGVDGFRCDVAPIIPLDFWIEARKKVAQEKADVVWLSESIEPEFIKWMREQGYEAHSDAEMYQAFDILYDYDVYGYARDFFQNKGSLNKYIEALAMQEYAFPEDYLKLHFTENHDVERIHALIPNLSTLRNFTAWSFFASGVGFLYAGQETLASKRPDLFEKDPIDLSIKDQKFYDFIKRLIEIKKLPVFNRKTRFDVRKDENSDVIIARIKDKENEYVGIFNLTGLEVGVSTDIKDEELTDIISGNSYPLRNGKIIIQEPIIAKIDD
ncbi:MAG: alpha-amylase family glycosyl hydrolase [Bacilli bacterium]|jgi:glycosidase|nr:alpha-amylase family glycosyl hydrolase [Bacilli bacterium]